MSKKSKKTPAQIERAQRKKATEVAKEKVHKEKLRRMNSIVRVYANLAKKLKRRVKMTDLIDLGRDDITPDVIKHHFRSLARLERASRDTFPERFHDVSIAQIQGPKALRHLAKTVENYQRYVITTAVTGCSVDKNFLASVENYCEKNNAALLVLVASDPAHNFPTKDGKRNLGSVDRELAERATLVVADTALNSNIYVSTIKLSAKHIDPITSLGRIGQRNGSFIYASPKQRMKAFPVSNEKFPHMLMTTGAITVPNYGTENYMSERTAYIAEHDHVMGAIVVEVVDDDIFHYRQIQADSKGSFIDLSIQYNKDGSTSYVAPEQLVMGDWHSGCTEPTAWAAWKDIQSKLGVKGFVLHDGYDGRSINHHERDDVIMRAKRAIAGEHNLSQEIDRYIEDLDMLSDLAKVTIVKSNHDEVLKRYLAKGYYVKDPENHRYSLNLAAASMDGHDPLKWAVEQKGLKNPKKIKWLDRDEDFIVAGIQLGAHGDKGANGARGSLRSMENSYGNSVTGHSHTPEILRGAWQVGTSSYLKLSYNEGPSSWFHASCLVYPNGSRQLINSIGGDWRLETDSYQLAS